MTEIVSFITIFLLVIASLYSLDRVFKVVKCYIRGEKFEQKRYERLLTFLTLSVLITALIV